MSLDRSTQTKLQAYGRGQGSGSGKDRGGHGSSGRSVWPIVNRWKG
ncbi:MAG: hypothetical protein WCH07_02425 [Deltaproteobacteria bacterium]